jgi:hypothetical protein
MKAKRKPATKSKTKAKAKPPKNPNAPTPEFYRKLGEAYREQEDGLGDLLIMAKITARAAMGDEEGEKIFTTYHLHDMIEDFRQEWYDCHKKAAGEVAS